MDKQELIDKAVEDLKGNWPYKLEGMYICSGGGELLCGETEFKKRAHEIGWINGYKYGLEYPTNGKKPDLPDDTMVQVKLMLQGSFGEPLSMRDVMAWSDVSSAWNPVEFKIVDNRYKPKQPESHSKPSVDNSWYERGENPPTGTECEVLNKELGDSAAWEKCRIDFMGKFRCIYSSESCYERVGNVDLTGMIEFRPIKSEIENFVEQSIIAIGQPKVLHEDVVVYFKKQFNAGARFVSQEIGS